MVPVGTGTGTSVVKKITYTTLGNIAMETVDSSICVSNTTSEAPDLSEQGAVQLPDGLGARLSSLSIDVSITQKSSDDSNYNVDDDQQTCITISTCDDDNDPRSLIINRIVTSLLMLLLLLFILL